MAVSGVDVLVGALVAVCVAAAWLAAALVRARRAHRRAVGERGWLLERERESAARAAVSAERARIAAELHDVVSHTVSVMVIQAGAAREVLATMPDEAAAAMAAVETAGRGAMTELRHLLGLLAPDQDGADGPYGAGEPYGGGTRGGAGGGPEHGERSEPEGDGLAPAPGLDRLGSLVDRIAFAGLPVEVRISGTPRPLPAGIDVTAYRIIQEALTNALRHGGGAKTEVTVRYADHWLRVEVLNGGPSVLTGVPGVPGMSGVPEDAGPGTGAVGQAGALAKRRRPGGTGRGLLGLRERVAVYGGDFDARRRLGGGFRVRARIPLDRP
ncbi:histidine kinase [Streptomyces sp. NBC_00669]|uniref:sensor histidine kinase n=1 Tax=Streptomyces sp. NBC_00669 TaxID=2976011 RepID=UPI002E2F61F3|nr:histidine kinase [Streptomyces sp. NBC_00669]